MKLHEILIAGTIGALIAATGIKTMSPEMAEITGEIQGHARVMDRYAVIKSEISGHDYTTGVASSLSAEEIGSIAAEMRASGTIAGEAIATAEVTAEAESAAARF